MTARYLTVPAVKAATWSVWHVERADHNTVCGRVLTGLVLRNARVLRSRVCAECLRMYRAESVKLAHEEPAS